MTQNITYIGLDVGKDRIEVMVAQTGKGQKMANTRQGISALAKRIGKTESAQVILEATGG
jgi:hypothetical protein